MHAELPQLTQPVRQHWPYVYHRRRKRILGINARQMAWGQVASLIGSVIAGVLLDTHKETLALLAGTFVILPGIFDLDGSIGAALSAKINHILESASMSARQTFVHTVWFALRQAILGGVLVGLVGGTIAVVFFDAVFWQIFGIGVGAITMSAVIGFPIIGLLSLLFRRLSINPDDVVGPIESSLFDILAVITTVVMVGWLL
jgi:cation transporter-like permease